MRSDNILINGHTERKRDFAKESGEMKNFQSSEELVGKI